MMMRHNSLIFKLLGAFLLVIAVGSVVLSILTSRATTKAFTLYTTRSGQVWGQRLAPVLADYYTQNGGWEGVDSVLLSSQGSTDLPAGNMTGKGLGKGPGQQSGSGMMTGFDQRLILANDQGIVISDTLNQWSGKQLTASELQVGTQILVDNTLAGTLIVTPNNLAQTGSPAGEFLSSMNQAIISSTVIAGIIALTLGALLFFQIINPLRKLSKAATAIADGDLNQRVDIRSKDEFGELGQTFNKMAENLADAETQRQHLVADIAHELRTPLTAIQGTLEAIQDGVLPMDEEQVTALHAETTLLNRLVGDLRLLSLAEAGHLKLELQETDVNALLQRGIERVKTQADQHGIRLIMDLQADIPRFLLDPDRIMQVLNNLINNALRYTPQGGSITIGSALQPGTRTLQVSITDTGSGIDPKDLPHVFDRFYRADKSRTRSSGGSGLGLAIVKQLVEAHSGEVWVESPVFQDEKNQGYGTRFSFTVPA